MPLGPLAEQFHHSIVEYLSMCQFLEIHFHLPVAHMNSPLSFLYNRTFETCKNTESASPSRAFEEAGFYRREHPTCRWPTAWPPPATARSRFCSCSAPEDGQAFIQHAAGDPSPLYLKLGVDRLLPKLQFVYDI